ncbi:MAG: 2-amino-4-hydroxy-6-hydroxymethyldihydropteridine diphosphokinase [Candidatus Dactylopiibacterium carminicum]|uniref:2-amino-4-hydroxy-6-hydroxymethyldihydropteridine pyrophosphokinase n=1 Tax=Candidatus Dactylopiibacterium carminicum TaxID=857335 RepID=A0A272ENI8_9RHOO|nr:2-amino-4-hydroxy-6-hydroxymethyldihydropteridine diphosphokinase [Candidatus Dactylopiibacterium carminicum]PAS91661.1 MAG: 2-amino-4-hydroxy-6-hydroxymethyldihydropteridine diphosphokinase [Candidatus Dactylopiibacterium carminicum]PAS97206.1 MAG: 2-amino-4-hydroxy-6-hydroxymethyldihydropteridine diphosphokinase [Candidatus Dactylopiibacterium carminicum]
MAWIGLGANLGTPAQTLREAIARLGAQPGCRLITHSSLYASAPLGEDTAGQPEYVNAVAALDTSLSARELLDMLLQVEREFGRQRSRRNAARTLDLDLLLYGHECIHVADLDVPHPRMHERAFVLIPLSELAREAHIPGRGFVGELLAVLPDQHIRRLPN